MRIEIKNSSHQPKSINSLLLYFQKLSQSPKWDYKGLMVELDPTIDCKANDALIRWIDINEGFNDKIIVNSLEEFNTNFKLING